MCSLVFCSVRRVLNALVHWCSSFYLPCPAFITLLTLMMYFLYQDVFFGAWHCLKSTECLDMCSLVLGLVWRVTELNILVHSEVTLPHLVFFFYFLFFNILSCRASYHTFNTHDVLTVSTCVLWYLALSEELLNALVHPKSISTPPPSPPSLAS